MKKSLSYLAATTALFLIVTPFAHAGTPSKAKKQRATARNTAAAVDYNTVTIRASQPAPAPVGGEIGNDAPHQERNPSQHPELFQYNR